MNKFKENFGYFTSLRFYSIFTSPFYYCYNILYDFNPPPPLFLPFRLCITLLHYFGYHSHYLSVSPFQVSLTLPFYCLRVQLVFSHPPITSFYFISTISKIFFPTTIPDEGLSPKRRIIKFFFKFTYFALGSVIPQSIVYFCKCLSEHDPRDTTNEKEKQS